MLSRTTQTSISGSSQTKSKKWAIVYGDGTLVLGSGRKDWEACPGENVQGIAQWVRNLPISERRWTGVSDRKIWTGLDEYDPFGFGPKKGKLIDDETYFKLFDLIARGDIFTSSN